MYKFSKKSIDVLSTIYGPLEALCRSVLSNSPYDFGIPSTGGKRTADEQNELFNKGWSKLDGYNKKSYHQSGLAVDIAIYDEHGLCYKCIDKYEEVSRVFMKQFQKMKNIGIFPKNSYLRWGGDWNRNGILVNEDPKESFVDLPHFEIRNL